ncbi:hypothetical protein ASG32_08130 [Methylobacterium sp. Leaf361]|uniref:hypothetical protein n=1 Tax=Methylobacterium sp. Leaf361 TaxID=1736352 RepID=UPI0006FE60EE|nr:hypothetical protein [Methylobacterium sp. Leaf361]KQS75055.1 hypothetical protein ASG32_08130 [Methylobacterium sp. Leaf361]
MKLSQRYRVDQLMKERERLRTSIAAALGDEDIKVQIQGSEAQGAVRQACLRAISQLYNDQLVVNTKALEDLGVDADDGPVHPAKPDRGVMVEDRRR